MRSRRGPRGGEGKLVGFLRLPGLGSSLVIAFLAGITYLGASAGGQYQDFIHDYGRPRDMAARALGFGIDSVTIAGQVELSEAQILNAAGVDARNLCCSSTSTRCRSKLLALPLVKNVTVRKLFPGPPGHRRDRAPPLWPVAEGRRRLHHRRRRRADRRLA